MTNCNACGRELNTDIIESYYRDRDYYCDREDCIEVSKTVFAERIKQEREEERLRLIKLKENRQAKIDEQARLSEIRIAKEAKTLGCEYSDEVNEQLDYKNNLTI